MSAIVATDDEWTEMSRNDDAMVANMLLRLRHAVPPPRPSSALRLVWTTRQRRSGSRKGDNDSKKKAKGVQSTRASPSTPLSFSAATSSSGGAAGECPEESSSRPTRSKVSTLKICGNRINKTIKKVKKKTLGELKVEEDELLKEKTILENELAKLRVKVAKEQAKNEFLKRKKLYLLQQVGSDESDEVKDEKCETVFELPDLNLPFEEEESNLQRE